MFDNVEYWLKGEEIQNYGDSLANVLLERMFLPLRTEMGVARLIGSSIADWSVKETIDARPEATAVYWGCGVRERGGFTWVSKDKVRILGVRGPLSAEELGMQLETPIGDPALFLPMLYEPEILPLYTGRSICIPHFCDDRPDEELLKLSGCDVVVRAKVGSQTDDLYHVTNIIASADFILSASLHGAIVAAAYDRPFCYWDAGIPTDIPFKWEDFAASANFQPRFANNIADARAIYSRYIKPVVMLPDLLPLANVAPFVVRPDVYLKLLGSNDNLAIEKLTAYLSSKLDRASRITKYGDEAKIINLRTKYDCTKRHLEIANDALIAAGLSAVPMEIHR